MRVCRTTTLLLQSTLQGTVPASVHMNRSARDRAMRTGAWMLAFLMWLAPVVQVFASTVAEAHCRAHGHLSATAPSPAHDATHAAHHSGDTAHADHDGVSDRGDEQRTCACPCDLACGPGMALLPALPTLGSAAPEQAVAAATVVHPQIIQSVPQRPPASSKLMA